MQHFYRKVTKRDGTEVEFNTSLIINAVSKAAQEIGQDIDVPLILDRVLKKLEGKELSVDLIQSTVESVLMNSSYKNVAKAYIEYRSMRDGVRERQSDLRQEIDKFFNMQNIDVANENANKDSRLIPTQRDLVAGMIAKDYAKKYMIPKRVMEYHNEGLLHWHDMDYSPFSPMYNCQLGGFERMLRNGFKMGNASIEQSKSIATAAAVTAQVIAQISSHSYGGTSFNRIDEVLAEYVTMSYKKHLAVADEWNISNREDYAKARTEKECYDAMNGLEYEVNTLHTSNGQTPFVTFGFGLGTSWEARLIQQSILKSRLAGLGKKRKTAVFPKLCFTLKDGLNLKPTDPNYDIKQLALECQRKRIYPDFLNYEQVVKVTGSFKTPMGEL